MTPFARLFPPVAVGRRSYSFFSSKSGGGRFFNPPKSPKVIASATTTTRSTQPGTSANKHQSGAGEPAITTTNAEQPEGSEQITHSKAPARLAAPECETPSAAIPSSSPNLSHLSHPLLKPHEFKLHNFFALHRPCLLLNQPTSALFESAQTAAPPAPAVDTIDNPPEASADADADAARQLSRALVINRVGGMVDWEAALRKLGVSAADGGSPAEDAMDVALDSTKRKRRRKMKKHKLKKRRRLSRSTRLRLGK